MVRQAHSPFSVWRKIAMATWQPRRDPIVRPMLPVTIATMSRVFREYLGDPAVFDPIPEHAVGAAH